MRERDPRSGTAGYAEAAEALAVCYESVSFETVHYDVLGFMPRHPSRALDVGAGTGRDAAALCARGHRVVAVEPTAELRAYAERLHTGSGIKWVDDRLPELSVVVGSGARFDLILLAAVWMHLDVAERQMGMGTLAGLLAPSGRIILSLRHGPVPEGRRMFEVSAEETVAVAAERGLACIHSSERMDALGRSGVRWSSVVLQAKPLQS